MQISPTCFSKPHFQCKIKILRKVSKIWKQFKPRWRGKAKLHLSSSTNLSTQGPNQTNGVHTLVAPQWARCTTTTHVRGRRTSESLFFVASLLKSRRGGLYILPRIQVCVGWEEDVDASMQNTTTEIDLSLGEEINFSFPPCSLQSLILRGDQIAREDGRDERMFLEDQTNEIHAFVMISFLHTDQHSHLRYNNN